MSRITEQVIKIGQRCLEQVPVIVLGSGASAQYGVGGMGALQDHLLKNVKPSDPSEKDAWNRFSADLAVSHDLEQTLHRIQLPAALEARMVWETRSMVLRDDLAVFNELIAGKIAFALTDLLRYLLRSTHPSVSIVTTNYDRLAEYASDAAGIGHFTSFSQGYFRAFEGANRAKQQAHAARQAEIWKVHGSVDWFQDPTGNAVSLPDVSSVPASFSPLLVTPGTRKYETTHDEPFRTIIAQSDAAFADARAIFSVGYGFRDRHIQPKLSNRVLKDKVPIVVLALTLTNEVKSLLARCSHPHYLALEKAGTGAKAFLPAHPDGIEIPEPIWEFGAFLDATVGEH
jgi:SIR2-like domain